MFTEVGAAGEDKEDVEDLKQIIILIFITNTAI